ncbi:fructosamine-3-kinase [Pseudonocardia hierapolitana]|uniref:Fructosamine-3-kinase n=1 Tax=Pseudonocardia hierapolitana TaxID=1128676 RepID=A0A561SY36_9PSEU|nr:fructosamine kinase family protein [Pseudonocardia hierapolitana]TWF79742.1 fructosamine-3-kinase [Pseudonocardia hierapolitana]
MASTVLGAEVRDRVPLGGGAARVRLADGRTVVVKDGDEAAIAAEAAGLRWLGAAGGARVPAVLDVNGGRLVTELVAGGTPGTRAAEELGRALARTHAAGAPAFGAAPPGGPADARIGAAPMRNAPAPSWPEWYATDRLLPYLRTARDAGTLTGDAARAIEAVADRLPELAGAAEPPARLHGDLWSGNVLWSPEGAVLIDPAAHGGHRETDLAMLALFGCPHLGTVLAAYDAAAPLAAGWRDRVPLHQLFPLLVHVVLFGGGYAAQALSAARAALRAA